MHNNRDDLVVILAGYADRMETFFAANPGFRSCIAHHIEFPDYGDDELMRICATMLEAEGRILSPGAQSALAEYVAVRRRQPHLISYFVVTGAHE